MRRSISIYMGALVITVFGAGATLLIVNTAFSMENPAYLGLDQIAQDGSLSQ